MSKRTFILFSTFIVIAVLGGLFMAAYQLYWHEKINNYIYEIATCGLQNESSCLENPRCEPIYRPFEKNGNADFDKCKLIPDFKKQSLSTAKLLCDQTGGKWEKIKYGEYCNCSIIKKVYIKEQGCTKQKRLVE